MENYFLTGLFLIGVFIACAQDLKRREVDDWLNLFLFIFGMVFIFAGAILFRDFEIIVRAGFLLIFMFIVMNLFYYGRVFAGGDAKLLFAMTPFFVGTTLLGSVINVGVFCFFLMVSGSFYGLFYSGVLWWKNKDKVNSEMKKVWRSFKIKYFVLVGVVLLFFGFVDVLFFIFGTWFFFFPFLFVFAKGLENVSMIREVSGLELREGDWLACDVAVGKKVIRADWEGISLEDIDLLKRKKKILIKEGIPFVPAFLFAFLAYLFLKGWFLGLFGF